MSIYFLRRLDDGNLPRFDGLHQSGNAGIKDLAGALNGCMGGSGHFPELAVGAADNLFHRCGRS
jgi:hypothetical protein